MYFIYQTIPNIIKKVFAIGTKVVLQIPAVKCANTYFDQYNNLKHFCIAVVDDRRSEYSDMYKTGRRSTLPAPMSSSDTGLFSILTKNIGKDLTRISMPVTLNEPLNTLQVVITSKVECR